MPSVCVRAACARATAPPRADHADQRQSDSEPNDFDILGLPGRADQPGLDAVVVVDRVDAAHLAQLVLGRLHVAGSNPSRGTGSSAPDRSSRNRRRSARSDLSSTGPSIRAVCQLRPPSSETSTRLTVPRPDHARPDSTLRPLCFSGACGDGMVTTDFASMTKVSGASGRRPAGRCISRSPRASATAGRRPRCGAAT